MKNCATCHHPETDHKVYETEQHCVGLKPDSKPMESGVFLPPSDVCDCKLFVSAENAVSLPVV